MSSVDDVSRIDHGRPSSFEASVGVYYHGRLQGSSFAAARPWLVGAAVALILTDVLAGHVPNIVRTALVTVGLGTISFLWLWGTFVLSERAFLWLRARPEMGDRRRVAAWLLVALGSKALLLPVVLAICLLISRAP